MGGTSWIHYVLFAVVAILVLGGGRFSNMMGDVAKGIKQFKKGMSEDDTAPVPPTRLEAGRADPVVDPVADRVRETER